MGVYTDGVLRSRRDLSKFIYMYIYINTYPLSMAEVRTWHQGIHYIIHKAAR